MAAARHLVVVATPEPAATDRLADRLRDEFAVRTAYAAEELLASLDDDVDVVLVDDALDAPRGLLRERADRAGWQIGLLVDSPDDGDARHRGPAPDRSFVDARVPTPTGVDRDSDSALVETVEWLACRARYRKRLEEFYELAETYADLPAGSEPDGADGRDSDGPGGEAGGDTPADAPDPAQLERHLERLRTDLEETYERLDYASAVDVAIDDPAGELPDDPAGELPDDVDPGA